MRSAKGLHPMVHGWKLRRDCDKYMVHEGGPLMDVEFSTEIDLSHGDKRAAGPPAGLSNPELFARIDAYTIGPADAELSFAGRLARENDWSDGYAAEVIVEYKKFVYLMCVSEGSLTPSRDVDEVWHLHLTYSRDYWERFCRDTLNRDLHHTPTEGGPDEADKFYGLYNDTLRAYEAEFGVRPLFPIWPSAEERFSETSNPAKISKDRYFLVPRRYYSFLTVVCVALFLAGCNLGGLYWFELYPLLFFVSLVFTIITFFNAYAPNKITKGGSAGASGCGGSGGCGASGCGGGGCGGGD